MENKRLINLLKSLKTDPEFESRPEFRARLKERLLSEVKPARQTGWFVALPEFSWGGWGRRLAWAAAGIVFLAAATTTVMAQKSLPTHKLYPVKIAGERAAMVAAKDDWKPQIAAGIADRRLEEIHQLEKNEETEAVAGAVDNYRRHLMQAENFRAGAGEEWAAGINRHWETLKQLEERLETESIPAAPDGNLPDAPVRATLAPARPTRPATTAPQPTETSETPAGIGEKHDRKDDKKNDKEKPDQMNVNLPIIQLTVPVPENLPLDLLP